MVDLTKIGGPIRPSGPGTMINNLSRRYTQCHLNVTCFMFSPPLGHGRPPDNYDKDTLVRDNKVYFLRYNTTVSKKMPNGVKGICTQ